MFGVSGKNGEAACNARPPSMAPAMSKVPLAGSLLTSEMTPNFAEPFALGLTPVRRTLAPMGTPWAFLTMPLTLAVGR